jgi:hypothetical protein
LERLGVQSIGERDFGFEREEKQKLGKIVMRNLLGTKTWDFDLGILDILGLWFWYFGHGGPRNPQGFPRSREPARLFLAGWVEKIQFK